MLLLLWAVGIIYHAWLRFVDNPEETMSLTLHEFVKDIGVVGLSAAILALVIVAMIAGGKAIMVLFDWPTKAKVAAKARQEERAEIQKELALALSKRKDDESVEDVIKKVFDKDSE